MRFQIGPIPEEPSFDPKQEPWRPLREFGPTMTPLAALPIGIVAAVLVFVMCAALTNDPISTEKSLYYIFPAFILIVPVHELIHAAFHPGFGFRRHSWLGFWPAQLIFYAHYSGELSRNRFIVIFLAPLFFISILAPLALCRTTRWNGLPIDAIVTTASLNAFMACVDILGACTLLFQLPARAITRNQGWLTYWRDPAEVSAAEMATTKETNAASGEAANTSDIST